jgi:GNAT superfamily N-acetyltransferase
MIAEDFKLTLMAKVGTTGGQKLISIRALEWPSDRNAVLAIDTSVILNQVYRLKREGNSFTLESAAQLPARTKRYNLAEEEDSIAGAIWARVALRNGVVVGIATMNYEAWNRRARLEHLYVDKAFRGQGVGRLLVEAALAEAKAVGMRCLWVETQTINAPAVEFYKHLGFTWCGFDTSLYDPTYILPSDEAIFFARDVGLN